MLNFSLDSLPARAELCSKGYPFHVIYLNGEFIGSEEYAFATRYNIASKLREGQNMLKVLVIPEGRTGWFSIDVASCPIAGSGGWFSIEGSGMPVNISTRNPDWQWTREDTLVYNNIVVCVRGTADNPWDGSAAVFSALSTEPRYPTGVMAISCRGAEELFPNGEAVTPYRPGGPVPLEGEVIFDFGAETLGYLEFELESPTDCGITLACAESFNALEREYPWHSWDRFRIDRGKNRILNPSRKGFRYVRVSSDHGSRLAVTNILNHKPGRELRNRGYFRCSDEFLNRVNEVACRTVELCAQKFLEDGIKRDRLCWTGDLRPEALVMYNQLGETEVVRDSLYAFAHHTNEHGVIQPSFPWKTGWVMADYVMWWIISLYEYYLHTGDVETLRELEPVAREQEKWLKERVDERGLFVTRAEYGAPITCWSSRKREGYTAYHNCLWYHTKHCLLHIGVALNPADWEKHLESRLARAANGDIQPFQATNFLKQVFVDKNGLWRDLDAEGRFKKIISQDSTINAAIARISLMPSSLDDLHRQEQESLLAIQKYAWTRFGSQAWWQEGSEPSDDPQSPIMPLYNAYEVEQRMEIGDWDGAVEVLRRCFGHMLELGATSFWEIIQKNGLPNEKGQEGLASLCHGWSGCPAAVFPKLLGFVAGGSADHTMLLPYGPQYCDLEFMEAGIPYDGELIRLKTEWDPKASVWRYSGLLPESSFPGFVTLPFAASEVTSLETANCAPDDYPDDDALVGIEGIKPGEEFSVTLKLKRPVLK